MQKKNSILFFLYSFLSPLILLCAVSYLLYPNPTKADENVNVSATVENVQVTPSATGGGSVSLPETSVRFSGEAYPSANIIILKNGVTVSKTKADNAGLFSVTLKEKYDSTILYSIYAKDITNNKSLLINYPIVVTVGYVTHLSGIRFPPTITLDKAQVRVGDYLTVSGYAMPQRDIQVVIASKDNTDKEKNETYTLTSSQNGRYSITLPLMQLPKGNYTVYVKYANHTYLSKLVKLIIGNSNILSISTSFNIPGDCNADGAINLVDFSVLAFWYKKNNPPKCIDLNYDKIVDLIDFSILAFYWTT